MWRKITTNQIKKALRETQTLRAKKFSPRRRPPSRGAQDRQNLISWRWSLPAPTDPVWWRSMHAISSYRGHRYRPPATNTVRPLQTPPARPPARHKHTHRQDRLQYIAPLSIAQCNEIFYSLKKPEPIFVSFGTHYPNNPSF